MSCTVVFYEPNNAFSGLEFKTETEKGIKKKVCDVLYNNIQMTFICIRLYIHDIYRYVHVAYVHTRCSFPN